MQIYNDEVLRGPENPSIKARPKGATYALNISADNQMFLGLFA